MKKLLAFFAALGFALLTLPAATAQPATDKFEQLSKNLDVPGLIVVEFDATGITSEHYAGVDGNNHPVTATTPFT